MERFSFAKNGSAQKSWAFCPSSRLDGSAGAGAGAGAGAYPRGGTYEQQKYSVSGYVNGYNPSLPAYPPTRAQIEAAAKRGIAAPGAGQGGYGAANRNGGYAGEIADQMSAQIRFEQARAAGGGGGGGSRPAQTLSSLSETSGGLTYSGHGAWDGPAPAGDPSKPKPGTPYYVTAPPEPAFDKSKEDIDVPLGVAGAVVGRVPLIGVDAKSLATNEKLFAEVYSGDIKHIRCPAMFVGKRGCRVCRREKSNRRRASERRHSVCLGRRLRRRSSRPLFVRRQSARSVGHHAVRPRDARVARVGHARRRLVKTGTTGSFRKSQSDRFGQRVRSDDRSGVPIPGRRPR
jgi:hypothetical protein